VEKIYQLHLNSIHKRETQQKPFEDLWDYKTHLAIQNKH
jgi:hypothetical protein